MKPIKTAQIVLAIIVILILTGWIKSIIKFSSCNFEPSYKAEVFYGIGSIVPPAGGIIGWIDIED